MPRRKSRTLPIFRRDFQDVIRWSETHFGDAAADRYRVLIRQALRSLFEDPRRPGVKARPDVAENTYIYHLMFSRDRVPGRTVGSPRHMILFRYAGDVIEFGRLLHDSRDVERHVPIEFLAT